MKLSRLSLLGSVLVVAACSAPPPVEEEMEWKGSALDGSSSATVFRTGGIGVRVRAEPTTDSEQVGSLPEGATVAIACQTSGQSVEGTDIWDRIESPRGYVLDKYLRTGHDGFIPGGERCSGDAVAEAPASSGAGMSAIWGGRSSSETFGFLAPNNLGYYAYGTEYGLDGSGHTGIDISVPYGTPLYAPSGGIVRCAGNEGPGTGGGGCGFFNDYGDAGGGAIQGCGRIELELDDGTAVILGHARTCALRPGTRFERGANVGTTGGMNGAHVHVEVRVRSASTRSGWRIIDPRSHFGG